MLSGNYLALAYDSPLQENTILPIQFGLKRWTFPFCILLTTCFGVFILPFLLPPPQVAAVSVANVAGFNNKVASLAVATLGIFVFFFSLQRPWLCLEENTTGYGRLSRRLVLVTVLICAGVISLLSYLIVISHVRYSSDAGYFIEQIGKQADYGRKLYKQVEFPYGPLIFYGPIAMRIILTPFHVSLTGAYFTTLVLEQIVGFLLVAWVINSLKILRKWKTFFFLLCAPLTLQLSFGLNYTFLRFIVPAAILVLASKLQRPWTVAACLFAGEVVSLAISPEMGFAFGAGSVVYAAYHFFTDGAAWFLGVGAPFVATTAFLIVAGDGYLDMLKLFARGLYNFIVEPLPHILVFLFAFIWLVPSVLAFLFRQGRKEAPLLVSLYILALALLPAALGRADSGHVFLNELPVYILSLVAISFFRQRQQTAWIMCVTVVILCTTYVNISVFRGSFRRRFVMKYSVMRMEI